MKNRRGESSLVKNEKLKLCCRQPDFENYNSYYSNRTIDDYQQVENYLCKVGVGGGGRGGGGGG